jgi:Ca2+-binding EF-hand superfamily protein
MATLDNEIRLANLLIALGDGEQEIEANRERLSKLPEFDPYLLFKFLDRSSRGHLTCADLLVFFEEFGIIFSQDQVETIFTDNLPDKKLTFDQ